MGEQSEGDERPDHRDAEAVAGIAGGAGDAGELAAHHGSDRCVVFFFSSPSTADV